MLEATARMLAVRAVASTEEAHAVAGMASAMHRIAAQIHTAAQAVSVMSAPGDADAAHWKFRSRLAANATKASFVASQTAGRVLDALWEPLVSCRELLEPHQYALASWHMSSAACSTDGAADAVRGGGIGAR